MGATLKNKNILYFPRFKVVSTNILALI